MDLACLCLEYLLELRRFVANTSKTRTTSKHRMAVCALLCEMSLMNRGWDLGIDGLVRLIRVSYKL